jgi:ligand-binding sensor domain-containing protein/serine phosphatase RsbU (regulator of sigma subunit)
MHCLDLFSGQYDFFSDVKLFSAYDGISQSKITCLFQDSRGFLWIGTEDGLNRFDGYEFVTYSHQPNDTNSISNNYINAICEDKQGFLWIATNKGLNNLDLNTGKIAIYRHNPKNSKSVSDDAIYNVYIDKQNTLWVKTQRFLEKFDPKTNSFKHFNHYHYLFNYISSNIRLPLFEDSKGRMWIGTKDGLNYFDRDLSLFDRYISLQFNKNSISSDEVLSICEDSKGNLWIGTSNGLNKFNAEKKDFKHYFPEINEKLISLGNKINALYLDNDNLLWVGTSAGLYIFDIHKETFFQPTSFNNELFKLPVQSIIRDKSGVVWIGSQNGLIKINTQKRKFKLYGLKQALVKLPSYNIGAMVAPDNNLLLFSVYGEGLALYNFQTSTVKFLKYPGKGNIPENYIYTIYQHRDGMYYLGTENGITVLDIAKGVFRNLSINSNILGSDFLLQNKINGIAAYDENNLWIASSYGLLNYNIQESRVSGYFYNLENQASISHNRVNCVYVDKNKLIWVGTENGLDTYNSENQIFKRSKDIYKNKNLLSATSVFCIQEDLTGFIWVGTASGLNKINLKDSTVTLYTEQEGLSDNLIYAIQVDLHNNIWVSTNKGINFIDPRKNVIRNYDIYDGLQDYEFNFNSSCKNKNNELFFGGISGFNRFHPDSLKENQYIPPVIITSIELITDKGKIVIKNPFQKRISIPFGTHLFTVNFSALDFTLPEKNNFAYKFYSDSENDWINLGTKHSATFSNLKPGKYTLKVKGSNSDYVWNNEGISVDFYIDSPFWLKPQAYYIYGFILVIILLGIYRYRTYSLRKTNKILKEKEIASIQIERQREQLASKNKSITDSINYAKRIQEALMPSGRSIKRVLPESFVYHKPKDIVSGDFFWVSERGNKIFVAAVDCTGHGVPGAFMSIIGVELFRKITHNQGVDNPAQILSILNKEFEDIFKDGDDYIMRDGMDIAFCVIDKNTMVLEYSGAVNPIYLIRDKKITEIAGSRFSVGLDDSSISDPTFDSKQIVLHEDDIIYMFSDGYADQFGGTDGKKFKYRRFRHLLLTIHQYPLEEQQHMLEDQINRWKGDCEQVDDILIIGFRPVFNQE